MSQEKKAPQLIAEREIHALMSDYHSFTLQQLQESKARIARMEAQEREARLSGIRPSSLSPLQKKH